MLLYMMHVILYFMLCGKLYEEYSLPAMVTCNHYHGMVDNVQCGYSILHATVHQNGTQPVAMWTFKLWALNGFEGNSLNIRKNCRNAGIVHYPL